MNKLIDIEHFYFIGIGGIGMSALAIYFNAQGKKVSGYDKTPSTITAKLESLGIEIHFDDKGDKVLNEVPEKEKTLVIYTPAVPKSFGELERFRESGFTLKKRAEVLGIIANASFCMAVAGTHGKTTTSSILGHLLAESGVKVTAFIGGITTNYNSNLILKGNEVIVVEADEFDRSFLELSPQIAAITSMDADHLDIYGDEQSIQDTFSQFASLVQTDRLFVKNGLPLSGITVGISDNAVYNASNIRIANGMYVFDFYHPNGVEKDLKFFLPGRHNLFNAITAIAMVNNYGLDVGVLRKPLASYTGVERRFTYRIKTEDRVLIDDYAHHPSEIAAMHQSLEEMYPDEPVMVIFQPHLFSRTQDFMEEFANELSKFYQVLLLDIYPARELPIEGISSEVLLSKIRSNNKALISKEAIKESIEKFEHKVIVMLGAGDIGVEAKKVTKELVYAS